MDSRQPSVPQGHGRANLSLALGCLTIRAVQRAFSLHSFSNPETEEPGGMACDFAAGKKHQQSHVIIFALPSRLPLAQA